MFVTLMNTGKITVTQKDSEAATRLGAIHRGTQVAGVILTTRLPRPHSRGIPILQKRGLPAHGILLPGRGSEYVVGLVELVRCPTHRFDFLIALRLRVDFSKEVLF